jgi:hypothetical protein
LILLPATSFSPLMLGLTWGQRASSWSSGLYFHGIITWADVFLYSGLHNGPDGPQYQGTRQGNIRHAPKTRSVTPLSMTNAVCTVFFTLGLSVSLTSNLTNLGSVWADVTPDLLMSVWYQYGCPEVPATALLLHLIHGGILTRANPKGKSPSV